MTERVHQPVGRIRFATVWIFMLLAGIGLAVRAFDLHVLNKEFLQKQGDIRSLRPIPLMAPRGMIRDRNGAPLAVSTPVDSICANPQIFDPSAAELKALAKLLDTTPKEINSTIAAKKDKGFVYLKRHNPPEIVNRVMALEISGIHTLREYHRYYPDSEVFAHVVGLTNLDDRGVAGIEKAQNDWLRGRDGEQVVMTDSLGRVVEYVDLKRPPHHGKDLILSLDRRLQYLAYRELKNAIYEHKAKSGSAVIMDVQTGEVLAMVNLPTYNPNNREDYDDDRSRNRAVTNMYEPGSTLKPFTIAAAIASGKFRSTSIIDTAPGYYQIGRYTIHDTHNYGQLDLTGVIQKSSNVAASKIALALPAKSLYEIHQNIGFGKVSGSGFPGEASGELEKSLYARDVERATISYGYGISTTTLQLARAYSILADDGRRRPVSFLFQSEPVEYEQVIDAEISRQVRRMMESVTVEGGTGAKASVPGFHVAGKTGTVRKHSSDGYSDKKFVAVFAGVAPARQPRLAMAIAIHEPQGKAYYGGEVAAPVFSQVMSGALRLLNVPPDDITEKQSQLAALAGKL